MDFKKRNGMKIIISLVLSLFCVQISVAQVIDINVDNILLQQRSYGGNDISYGDIKKYLDDETVYISRCEDLNRYNRKLSENISRYFYFSSHNTPYSDYVIEPYTQKMNEFVTAIKTLLRNGDCFSEQYHFDVFRFNIYKEAIKFYYNHSIIHSDYLKEKQEYERNERLKLDRIVEERKNQHQKNIEETQSQIQKLEAENGGKLNALKDEITIMRKANEEKKKMEIKKLSVTNFAANKKKIEEKYQKIEVEQLKSLDEKLEKATYEAENNAEIQKVKAKLKSLEQVSEQSFRENLPPMEPFDDSSFKEKHTKVEEEHKESLKHNALKLRSLGIDNEQLKPILEIIYTNEECKSVFRFLDENKDSTGKRILKGVKNEAKNFFKILIN